MCGRTPTLLKRDDQTTVSPNRSTAPHAARERTSVGLIYIWCMHALAQRHGRPRVRFDRAEHAVDSCLGFRVPCRPSLHLKHDAAVLLARTIDHSGSGPQSTDTPPLHSRRGRRCVWVSRSLPRSCCQWCSWSARRMISELGLLFVRQ